MCYQIMHHRMIATALALTMTLSFAQSSPAQETNQQEQKPEQVTGQLVPQAEPAPVIVLTPELVKAYHDYEASRLRWHQYRFVELPRKRQELDNQVSQLSARTKELKRRLRDFQPFLNIGRTPVVRTAAANDRLTLQATEQSLKLAKTQRINLMRFSGRTAKLLQLEALEAATRVRQLTAAATQFQATER